MSEDKSSEVLDFLRAWRETADGRLGRIEERLEKIETEIAGMVGYRKQVEAELTVLRTRQDQQDVFNRWISTFFAELQATLARIERKLDEGG